MNEVEFPLFAIDSVLTEAPSPLFVANNSPAPDEVEVSKFAGISFDILGFEAIGGANLVTEGGGFNIVTEGGGYNLVTGAAGIAVADPAILASTQVYITTNDGAEVLVYDGSAGGFQTGYDGPGSAVTSPDAATRRFAIDPTGEFSSLDVMTLRVVSENTSSTLNATWSFTIQDLTAPRLIAAEMPSKTVVRVTFDELVSDSALAASAYQFTALNTFPEVGVPVAAVAVERISNFEIAITLDREPTFGQLYRLLATGVEDGRGNVITSPDDAIEFSAFTPPFPEARRFNWYRDLLAEKWRREDVTRELEAFGNAIQDSIDLSLCLIDEWGKIRDPDRAPVQFLDAMLEDLGNPFDFDLTETEKRKLVRVLVDLYKLKGTGKGIIAAVRILLGVEIAINALGSEGWILGVDELGLATLGPSSQFARYSFEITSVEVLTTEQESAIAKIANYMKTAREHLVRITGGTEPLTPDHVELGLSELGSTWILH